MAQVTVQGGYATIPGSGTANVTLQDQIAAAILAAATGAGSSLFTQTVTGGTPPTAPGSANPSEALIADAGGNNYSLGSYEYIVNNATGVDTINLVPNQGLISGTVGGVYTGLGGDTVALGGGNNLFAATVSGLFPSADVVAAGAGNDTIFDANGGTISGGAGANLLSTWTTAGAVTMLSSGTQDTVVALSSSSATVQTSGSKALVFADPFDSSSLYVQDTGSNTTVVGGPGAETVSAGGTNILVGAGSGSLLFLGGASAATVFGYAGASESLVGGSGGILYDNLGANTTVTGGSGVVTMFGGAGGSVTYNSSVGGAVFQALDGAETLNAAGSSTGNLIAAANSQASIPAGTAADSLVGGSGNDTFFGGNGSATMTGGAGHNVFAFFKFLGAGTDVVTDFTSNDVVLTFGYGTAQAATALAGAVSGGGNTTVTLSDNTKITFLGISSASSLTGHFASGV